MKQSTLKSTGIKRLTLFLLASTLSVGAFSGELLIGKPDVDFSAVATMDIGGVMTMTDKFSYAGGKVRSETESSMAMMGKRITISRPDIGKEWALNPKEKSYTETAYDPRDSRAAIDFGDDVEVLIHETLGTETKLGRTVTKRKVIVKNGEGVKEGGFYWIDSDNIMLEYAFVFVREGEKQKIHYVVTDLNVGSQPDDLFDLPSGYKKGGAMGMFSSIGDAAGSLFGGGDEPSSQSKSASTKDASASGEPNVAQTSEAGSAEAVEDDDVFGDLGDELLVDPAMEAAKNATKESIYNETRDLVKEGFKAIFD